LGFLFRQTFALGYFNVREIYADHEAFAVVRAGFREHPIIGRDAGFVLRFFLKM